MALEVVAATHQKKAPIEAATSREGLVSRVASSVTFEKSPRLRAFFLHVCRCALADKPEEATEQQIGIKVYERPPGYNPNEDNIVRSQARVLRLKLEHHFANEGKHEPVVITIPKGQYLPTFETRAADAPRQLDITPVREADSKTPRLLGAAAILLSAIFFALGILLFRPKNPSTPRAAESPATSGSVAILPEANGPSENQRVAAVAPRSAEIRIAAGHNGGPYIDAWGQRWEADRFFKGGMVQPGPAHFFPPVPDAGLFKTIRQAVSADLMVPQDQRAFQYDIPLLPGVYELRLYFADPLRQPGADQKEDAQNLRHIDVELNGHPLLIDLDPVADAGTAAVDVRAFKDVQPAQDGKLHLEFRSRWGQPAFVSAIQIAPGTPGKLTPIRISTHESDLTDSDGIHWSGDRFFIDGRTWTQPKPPPSGPRIPALYESERHGNFSYAIPVPPGSYTVKLHFLESFFSPLIPEAYCHDVGCRIFDVTCNGVLLLQDFDVVQAAGGAFRPVIREFHALHPNGQGKLLISFSPKVNYAEVRAIEVIDEAK